MRLKLFRTGSKDFASIIQGKAPSLPISFINTSFNSRIFQYFHNRTCTLKQTCLNIRLSKQRT